MKDFSAVETLTAINIQEMLEAAGLENVRRGRALLEQICMLAAKRFARQVASFDEMVGTDGLRESSLCFIENHIRRLEVAGREHIPAEGPLLIVSNHPGLSDSVALLASLPRTDLRIVVAERPFLQALNHTSRHLIYLRSAEINRNLRKITNHLRSGGAVLIFPGGQIEPDPATMTGAIESLQSWSRSIGLIIRLVNEIRVVPAIVSGVVCPAAQHHPLTRIRKRLKDRERFGALLQTLVPAYKNVNVRVAFGPPLSHITLQACESDTAAITETVIRHARRLLEAPPGDWQVLVETETSSKRLNRPGG
jgi:1-acyl-sn-glycerol-3-phosphate acyltransferase